MKLSEILLSFSQKNFIIHAEFVCRIDECFIFFLLTITKVRLNKVSMLPFHQSSVNLFFARIKYAHWFLINLLFWTLSEISIDWIYYIKPRVFNVLLFISTWKYLLQFIPLGLFYIYSTINKFIRFYFEKLFSIILIERRIFLVPCGNNLSVVIFVMKYIWP